MTTSKTAISTMAALIATALAASHAHAGANDLTRLRYDAEGGDWVTCVTRASSLLRDPDAKVSEDSVVDALTKPVGTLAVGAKPTVKALAAECLAQSKQDPDKVKAWSSALWIPVGSLRADSKTMQEHPYDFSYDTLTKESARCAPAIDLASQVLGADATIQLGDWSGTLAAAKTEICDVAAKAAGDMKAKKLEPFVKAGIKADKLKMIDDTNVSVEIGIPGGTFTLDPKALAKANPWFSESTGDDCAGGHVTTHVHRYQFDKDQKLVKESSKDYCGEVPKSAYR